MIQLDRSLLGAAPTLLFTVSEARGSTRLDRASRSDASPAFFLGALGEQILDVAQAEGEPEVEPYRLTNDLGREPVARIVDFPHGNQVSRPPKFGDLVPA